MAPLSDVTSVADVPIYLNYKETRKMLTRTHTYRVIILATFFLALHSSPSVGQTVSKNDREVGRIMLRNVRDAIKKDYYDPEFHGVNIDETFKSAEEKISEATTNGQIFGIIAKPL